MKMENVVDRSALAVAERTSPAPPPPLPVPSTSYSNNPTMNMLLDQSAKDSWDRLFHEAYRADVAIWTENNGVIYAHASILGTASFVLRGILNQSKKHGARRQSISILGVPHDAVRIFVRFLYSSSYEKEDMEEFALHLLVLSHVYVIPHLKRECERSLERATSALNIESVLDVFQLALLCDAPRLGFICHRMILKNLKSVAATEGWAAMKESHPVLEKRILQSAVDEANRKKEIMKRKNERKVYGQLCEAMEALVHICKDGCRTIGPHDKDLKENKAPCGFGACKGLESLVRHLAACKPRGLGGCVHCKRMWQLLELHSRLCADSHACRVPLCRNFKERVRKLSTKEDMKWKILVKKVLRTNAILGRPIFPWAIPISSITL